MELDLVQKVELKLLLADSDEKLSASLANFLPPLLQKLASPNIEVVRKVVEVLQFVKQRKRQSQNVRFPIKKLIELYHKSVLDLTPGVVRQNRQVLSFIGLELVHSLQENPEIFSLDTFVYGIRVDSNQDGAVKDLVGEQFSLFLLYLIKSSDITAAANATPAASAPSSPIDISGWDPDDLEVIKNRLPDLFLLNLKAKEFAQPALSTERVLFFTNHGAKLGIVLNPENESGINIARKTIINKLARHHPIEFKYTLVAAMGDSMLDLSRQARSEVLKLHGFEPKVLYNWAIYGNEALRTEVVELLIRQRDYQDLDPNIIFMAFRQGGDLRLRQASLRLLQQSVTEDSSAHKKLLSRWGPEINEQIGRLLHQYIIDDGWPRSQAHSSIQVNLRQLCYELLGAFSPTRATLSFLFQSLERDSADVAPSIQKSLSWILEAGDVEVEAEKLLGFMKSSKSNRTRYAAVKFAESRLSPKLPVQRVICLLGLDTSKNRSDVISEAQRGLLADSAEHLPPFNDMLNKVNETMDLDIAPAEVVNATILFLLSCLVRWPTASSEWMSDLTASVSLSKSPLEPLLVQHVSELLPFLTLLLSFVYTEHYHEIVPSLLRKIFLILPPTDKVQIATSGLVNVGKLVAALNNDSNEYGSFVAEYSPQIAPQMQIPALSSKLHVLARAFRAVELNAPSSDVNKLAVSTKNIEAIQVLAASNQLMLSEASQKAADSSQFALACLAVYSDEPSRKEIFSKLLSHTPKSFDDIVANGEAISVAASGWASKVLQDRYPYLIVMQDLSQGQRNWNLEEEVLKSVVNGIRGSPESRRIACVRLLCLTQYSFYNIQEFPGVASGIQSCFMSLLSDSDDVTQESAGRGLSILFENSIADPKLQNALLSNLLSSFTDDNKARSHTAGMLTAETQVFEPGTLPSEPKGGGSISTYKDVLNLANETGDSSLIYKFMSLSASSQIWNGRKGMAFSLEQIIAKSELAEQTANGSELGQKLIPKLFRYLHDPMEVTKESMKHIWTSLVPSSRRSQTIKLYLSGILSELLIGVINREWRVRQASTYALADLISQGYLQDNVELWNAGFRAVDDIKDSVSTAGSELLKSLTQSLVRANSMGRSSDLSSIIPFLLKGLSNESTVKFSLETLLKLSETDGFKPWAATVLEELTLQLSSLEPQALNYFALNTSQHLVDEARNKGLRSSPIMQGIEAMVERGAPTTDEMWDILPQIIKKSVGVSSQLAGSRLIILTCMQSYGESKKATDPLLKAAMAQLWSNNEIVSENYASAIGYLCRQLPLTSVVFYVEQLRTKFLKSEADDNQTRNIIALALKNMSTNANDVFNSVSSTALPLAYVGKFATSDPKAKTFTEVWDNNTGGMLSLKLYATEIVQFSLQILQDSSVRSLKVAASKALSEVFSHIEQANSARFQKDASSITKVLLENLAGRSWPGKEHVFTALVSTYPFLGTETELSTQIGDRVLNEIQRKNEEYKLAVFPSVAKFVKFAESKDDLAKSEILDQIKEQLADQLLSITEGDNDAFISAFIAAYEAVSAVDSKAKILEHVLSLNSWKFRIAACEAVSKQPYNERVWLLITEKAANDEQHERVRLQWGKAAAHLKDHPQVIKDVQSRLVHEKSSLVIAELNNIIKKV